MKNLYSAVIQQIEEDKQMSTFFYEILNSANVYLFGGAVRNYLDNDFGNVRDLDFVIEFKNVEDTIEKYIGKNIKYKKNQFNGYKFSLKGICIDMWELKDTWAFKEGKIQPSVQNLLDSVFLNIDSVVYSMNEQDYVNECNCKYKEIIQNQVLDVVMEDNPCVELNLLRALVLREKYRLIFSDELKRIFHHYEEKSGFFNELIQLQNKHYGKQVLSIKSIEKMLDENT